MELSGKLILVIGLGESGLAMARWLARQGARVRVADSRSAPPQAAALRVAVPEAVVFAGPFAAEAFAGVELMAISPGVPVAELLSESDFIISYFNFSFKSGYKPFIIQRYIFFSINSQNMKEKIRKVNYRIKSFRYFIILNVRFL